LACLSLESWPLQVVVTNVFCGNMQEELKILRLRYSILQEEELENREKELEELLTVKKDASVRRLCCVNLIFRLS